jgi:hypothetical protein
MLNVVMLSVAVFIVMLIVIMLSVVAPEIGVNYASKNVYKIGFDRKKRLNRI